MKVWGIFNISIKRVASFGKYKCIDEDGEDVPGLIIELQQAFSRIGVQLTDSEGEFRSTYDILQSLSEVYPRLDSVTQAYISERSSEYVQKCA